MTTIINTIATQYDDRGNGPVMLLLHGWKDSLNTFDPLMEHLSSRYRVVRLDLPGFGKTERPPLTWNVADYAKFVRSFCDKQGFAPDYLVGHSFGGRVIIKGVALGLFSPKKVVLIASGGIATNTSARNRIVGAVAKVGKATLAIPPLTGLRTALKKKLYGSLKSDYFDAGPLKQIYLNTIREDLTEDAKKNVLPTLLVWGTDDVMTPLEHGRTFKRVMPHAQLAVIDGASHFVHQEHAGRVATLITEFCI